MNRLIRWLTGRRTGLPAPHHTTVPRPWRYTATHWTPYHGRGARP